MHTKYTLHFNVGARKLRKISQMCFLFVPITITYLYKTIFKNGVDNSFTFSILIFVSKWTAVAQWLRYCVINRKVAGSIPASVSRFFIDIKSFRSNYGPGVDSSSNRNEYQEYFLEVKAVGA